MIDSIGMPKNNKKLAEVMRDHADRERCRLAALRLQYRIVSYYMRGGRRISVHGPDNERITTLELNEKGKLPVTVEKFLADANRLQGLIQSIDVRPDVYSHLTSLKALREAAGARVVANHMIRAEHLQKVSARAAHYFSVYGSCGVMGHVGSLPNQGFYSEYEVVHPMQLMPFPSIGNDATLVRGVMRERLVDLQHLKKKYPNCGRHLNQMEYWEREVGETMDLDVVDLGDDGFLGAAGRVTQTSDPTVQTVVRVRELWVDGPNETCSLYAAASGDYLFDRQDDEFGTMHCSLGHGHFIDVGDFHGAGLFRLQFSLMSRYEKLIEDLINNVRELDRYPVVVLPRGTFNERTAFKGDNELRLVMVEPDYPTAMISGQNAIRPTMIQPANSGDLPGRTAAYLDQVLSSITPVRDLIQEKGRIDALPAMQFMEEERTKSIAAPIENYARMFGRAHKAVIARGAAELALSNTAIPVGNLSLDMVGLRIDQASQTMTFMDNPIPNFRNVEVSTKQTSPRSEVVRKIEALRMIEMFGPDQFDRVIMYLLDNDIDIAMYLEDFKEARQTVVENILTLYGDGQENSEILVTPLTELPEFQLRYLRAFMSSRKMKMASSEVIEDFMTYYETLLAYQGMIIPESLPDPYMVQSQGMPQSQPQQALPGPT